MDLKPPPVNGEATFSTATLQPLAATDQPDALRTPRAPAPGALDGCSTCSACGYQVWASSVPGVQGLAVNDAGEVLLGRRNGDPGSGLWDVPGGFVHCATWLVRPVGGRLEAGDDLAHVEWFAADRLPGAADFAFPTHVEIVDVWAASRQVDTGRA